VVVGLGNPGPEYDQTRHNVGRQAVELLAQRRGVSFSRKGDALWARARLLLGDVYLLLPLTFMNDSGKAVAAFLRFRKIPPAGLVVVTDDMDLSPGRVRVRPGGSSGGHHGMDSIIERVKTSDFARVRIGIGKPAAPFLGADHVLSKVPKEERSLLDRAVQRAADAVETLLKKGVEAAMQEFNKDVEED
jgi:PTH1 family peptidyl-tRNA hydrolase